MAVATILGWLVLPDTLLTEPADAAAVASAGFRDGFCRCLTGVPTRCSS